MAKQRQLTGDERKEAEKREEEARIWISGLEAVKAKIGLKRCTICPLRRSFCAGRVTRKAHYFPGSSLTLR